MVRSRGAAATGEAGGLGSNLGLLLRKVEVAGIAVDVVTGRRLGLHVASPDAQTVPLAAGATVAREATVVLRPRPSVGLAPARAAVRDAVGGNRAAVRLVEGLAQVRGSGVLP